VRALREMAAIVIVESALVNKFWCEPLNCSRCNVLPVLAKMAVYRAEHFMDGKLRYECWLCGRMGPKAQSHEAAMKKWNAMQSREAR
jgi:hypothetical protein